MQIQLRHKNSDGIAIFIVLISVFALAAMAWIFTYQMRVEMTLAANANNEPEMEWMGRSGIELARYVLGQELATPGPGQRFDALNQKWAGGFGETNDMLAAIQLTDVPLGNGTFSVKITDHERKFNINTVINNEALMTQALVLIGIDASEIPVIIACLQDWIDPDSETHPGGAESDYYQTLDPPYFAKNGPIDDITELLLIKGITPEIYWGSASTNHQSGRFQPHAAGANNSLLPNASLISVGMADLFTPLSNGKININTASATTLRMLGIDESSANRLITLRQGPDGVDGTADDVPFNNTGEIINAGLPSQIVQQFMPYLTVRSSTFEVQVDVQVGISRRRYLATVVRNSPKDIQILMMRWE